MIRLIAFDADDTLWHNEVLFTDTQERFRALLRHYHDDDWIDQTLFETEKRNLAHFGYGVKGFTLSMIETAIELTEGRIDAQKIQRIVELGREMLLAPVELLEGARDTVATLAETHRLMLITKGDLLDQETKIARSGLGDYFDHIEIVSEKDRATYRALFDRYEIQPERFLMVGNSLRSDILPVAALGAHAVHIPYHQTWEHERVEDSDARDASYIRIHRIEELPETLHRLGDGAPS